MSNSERDLVIVGGGIAGMTAAIYGARAGLDLLLLEKTVCGGVANSSGRVENFPSHGAISGTELMRKVRTQVQAFQVAIEELTEVEDVQVESPWKLVVTSAGRYLAKALIIATGSVPNRLPIEASCDERVHYCALCDGPLYKGKDIVVVGGGNTGFDESLYLVSLGVRSVVLVECRDTCGAADSVQSRARSTGRIEVRTNCRVCTVVPQNDRVRMTGEDVRTGSSDVVITDGVFVYVGHRPHTAIVDGKLNLDRSGYIMTDALMHTSCPGVFAAGDVIAKTYRQLTTAMADGTIAALEASRYVREWR
jgi:thioredoxin reductase (NADPH)